MSYIASDKSHTSLGISFLLNQFPLGMILDLPTFRAVTFLMTSHSKIHGHILKTIKYHAKMTHFFILPPLYFNRFNLYRSIHLLSLNNKFRVKESYMLLSKVLSVARHLVKICGFVFMLKVVYAKIYLQFCHHPVYCLSFALRMAGLVFDQ